MWRAALRTIRCNNDKSLSDHRLLSAVRHCTKQSSINEAQHFNYLGLHRAHRSTAVEAAVSEEDDISLASSPSCSNSCAAAAAAAGDIVGQNSNPKRHKDSQKKSSRYFLQSLRTDIKDDYSLQSLSSDDKEDYFLQRLMSDDKEDFKGFWNRDKKYFKGIGNEEDFKGIRKDNIVEDFKGLRNHDNKDFKGIRNDNNDEDFKGLSSPDNKYFKGIKNDNNVEDLKGLRNHGNKDFKGIRNDNYEDDFKGSRIHDKNDFKAIRKDNNKGVQAVRRKEIDMRRRQVKMETEAWKNATEEYKRLAIEMCSLKLAPNIPYVQSLFLGWFDPLRNAISDVQKAHKAKTGNKKKSSTHEEYLCLLPADMMAVITMHMVTTLLMTGKDKDCSVPVLQAALKLGEAVEQEVRVHKFLEDTKKPKKAQKNKSQADTSNLNDEYLQQKITKLLKRSKGRIVRDILSKSDKSNSWDNVTHAKVGSALLDMLIQTAYIQPPIDQSLQDPPEIRPAFKHIFKTSMDEIRKRTKRKGVIECDPLVKQGLERMARHVVTPYTPMLIKPNTWKGYNKGSYLFLPSHVMRIHGSRKQREAMKNVPKNQMQKVYQALDFLGSTKWRINRKILHVVESIWAEGGGFGDIITRKDVLLPEKPAIEDELEIKKWKRQTWEAERKNMILYSRRCDLELKLSVARKMKDEECFYYPHNLDFRGRAYPMHPHLNHLGSDLCRGILEFAEGRPLGNRGLSWLKIHLANLYGSGVDKLSFDGRMAFVEDNINNIFESAEKPLEGKRWWLKAEDPLQFLATCMDLHDAIKCSSAESFICHIPVHQDGSCNGLQHYAALGRDKLGAEAVNLTHQEKPADIYSGVAARVEAIVRRDALNDEATFENARWAKMLLGQINRKLVKQTVMTSVYGVTYIGAREQIRKRLKERGAFPDQNELFKVSSYCAQVTLTALGEMFEAARDIMGWLNDCAKTIASENETVRWTSSMGLPIVQPYQKKSNRMVRTSLQTLALPEECDKVLPRQQRTAFPPNFVHSLDSTHMMMTALACNKAGITFAGVHDSYWTHASDVDQMNTILREKFVELYSQPILENLLESFKKSFPDSEFPELPARGDFDLKEVLKSPYFFN